MAAHGFYYAPDPSSQKACTIGGNVAENSGGAHCLKYGVTINHVLGLEVVLPYGEVVHLGGAGAHPPGYDLTGAFVGSEGTFGIATKVILRLHREPEAVRTLLAAFGPDDAGDAGPDHRRRDRPAALEMIDTLTIQAVEAAIHAGYPRTPPACCWSRWTARRRGEDQAEEVERSAGRPAGPRSDAARRGRARPALKGRKWARRDGAAHPDYYVQDGVVPRTALPDVLRGISDGRGARLRVANVFHAGDGNLHPLVLYDGGSRRGGAGR